ncbi:MAG: hypothetical protein ACFFE8_06785 [Candidatus Heimdallarchaeota archaeon]
MIYLNQLSLGIPHIILNLDFFQQTLDLHVAEVFYVTLGILLVLPFFTIYLLPKANSPFITIRGLIKLLLMDIFFLSVLLIIEFLGNPTTPIFGLLIFQPETSEFFIVGFLWFFIYLTFFYPTYLDLLRQNIIYDSDLSHHELVESIEKSVNALRGRRTRSAENLPNFFQYYIPGAYYLTYYLNVLIGDKDEESNLTKVNFTFSHSVRNLNILKFLVFLMFGVILLSRSDWTLRPTVFGTIVDAEIIFTVLALGFIFFNLLIAYTCENLMFQREAAHKKMVLDFGQLSSNKPDLEEIRERARAKLGMTKEELTIAEIKKRAREKLDSSVQKAERERKERIDTILDRADSTLNPKISPGVIRMETLIRETKKILNATPVATSVKLAQVVEMLGTEKTSNDEIESIIIGLVNKREVRGEYDIWGKTYSGGTARNRFIDRTLENMEINKGDLDSLNVSGESIQVTFRTPYSENEKVDKMSVKKKESG